MPRPNPARLAAITKTRPARQAGRGVTRSDPELMRIGGINAGGWPTLSEHPEDVRVSGLSLADLGAVVGPARLDVDTPSDRVPVSLGDRPGWSASAARG